MKIGGTWFKPWQEKPSRQLYDVAAWAVVRVATGEICSIWDSHIEAQMAATTGHPGEYTSVLLSGKYGECGGMPYV
jgi:hypothetical protein